MAKSARNFDVDNARKYYGSYNLFRKVGGFVTDKPQTEFKVIVRQVKPGRIAIWEIDEKEALRMVRALTLLKSQTCASCDVWSLSLNGGAMRLYYGSIEGLKDSDQGWHKATLKQLPGLGVDFSTGVDIYADDAFVASFLEDALQVDFPNIQHIQNICNKKLVTLPDAPGRVIFKSQTVPQQLATQVSDAADFPSDGHGRAN